MDSDRDLMLRAAAGEMDAFAELVRRHQEAAWRAAYRMLSDPEAAEDVVQETFLRILESAARYRPTASFRTFLFTVLRRLVIDRYRKKQPVVMNSLPPVEAGDDPSDAVETQERREVVRRALGGLPERQRTALVLQQYEGLSYTEVAEVMGCSLGAVESLLVRARRTLRSALQQYVDGGQL